jgi:hypothetical protein
VLNNQSAIPTTVFEIMAVTKMNKQEDIFAPFFAMLFLVVIVSFYMFARRIPFLLDYVEKHKCDMRELGNPASRHYLVVVSPASVRNPSDNLKNLFEVPTIFYALVMYLFVTNQVDDLYLQTAWAFVFFRYVHSAIHCTFNMIEIRSHVYALSSFVLFSMIFRASYYLFGLQETLFSS